MTSPGIPLTEFLNYLRIQKKIGPDDFTGEDLEDLSKQFAKALSVQNRNKLGIDKVTGRIGLTLVEDEDKRVEYATNCELLMSDQTKTTVLVNWPPDSDLYFRLPEKGPDPVPQSKLPVVDKPHGR
ncbi:hypothetical protein FRC17_007603 [Serendipita sp. 399]|nr:hypothetical protein FRC17_007603 [Serendipita sp. 399]